METEVHAHDTNSDRCITICQFCRKRVHQQRNGAWYHTRTSSEFCNWPSGTGRKAVPAEIKVRDRG